MSGGINLYQWSQLEPLYVAAGCQARLAVMNTSKLFVGSVLGFSVKNRVVRITLVIVRTTIDPDKPSSVGLCFEDRLHSLRSCSPNRFFTRGIDGLGDVVFTIIDPQCAHEIAPTELPVLKTGWSYALSEQHDRTGKLPERPRLKPVNPTS